jgi:ferredoxin
LRRSDDAQNGYRLRAGISKVRTVEKGKTARYGRTDTPKGTDMTYTICESCIDVKDRACVDECPVDCIYEGGRMLYIHPDECVDCGACEPVCPVTAIFYEDDVPAEWKQFTPVNAEFFAENVSAIGSPGGAAQVGPVAVDHPVVAGWPSVG